MPTIEIEKKLDMVWDTKSLKQQIVYELFFRKYTGRKRQILLQNWNVILMI